MLYRFLGGGGGEGTSTSSTGGSGLGSSREVDALEDDERVRGGGSGGSGTSGDAAPSRAGGH